MTTYIARHAAANLVLQAGETMRAGGDALHAFAKRLDDWLAARARSIDDQNALGAMSERELRDIGIDPARVHGAAQPWLRDWAA